MAEIAEIVIIAGVEILGFILSNMGNNMSLKEHHGIMEKQKIDMENEKKVAVNALWTVKENEKKVAVNALWTMKENEKNDLKKEKNDAVNALKTEKEQERIRLENEKKVAVDALKNEKDQERIRLENEKKVAVDALKNEKDQEKIRLENEKKDAVNALKKEKEQERIRLENEKKDQKVEHDVKEKEQSENYEGKMKELNEKEEKELNEKHEKKEKELSEKHEKKEKELSEKHEKKEKEMQSDLKEMNEKRLEEVKLHSEEKQDLIVGACQMEKAYERAINVNAAQTLNALEFIQTKLRFENENAKVNSTIREIAAGGRAMEESRKIMNEKLLYGDDENPSSIEQATQIAKKMMKTDYRQLNELIKELVIMVSNPNFVKDTGDERKEAILKMELIMNDLYEELCTFIQGLKRDPQSVTTDGIKKRLDQLRSTVDGFPSILTVTEYLELMRKGIANSIGNSITGSAIPSIGNSITGSVIPSIGLP